MTDRFGAKTLQQKVQQPVRLFKIPVVQLRLVEQDPIDPVRGDLLRLPYRSFLKKLVDLAVKLVHRIREDRQTVGGTRPHNPGHGRLQSELLHGLNQLTAEEECRSPLAVLGFLMTRVSLLSPHVRDGGTYPELGHEPRNIGKSLSSDFFIFRAETQHQIADATLLYRDFEILPIPLL